MTQMAASSDDLSRWNNFDWKRTMETFGDKDEAIVAKGVSGEIEAIWYASPRVYRPRSEWELTSPANLEN